MFLNFKKIRPILAFLLAGTAMQSFASVYDPTYKVRILFVQDASSSVSKNMDVYNRDRIAHLNNVLRNSYVDLKGEYAGFISLPEQVSSLNELKNNAAIIKAKETYQADIVTLWSRSIFESISACGVAMLAKTNEAAYSAVNTKASCNKSDTFVHEVGHNLGLSHHKTDAHKFADYSVGYGNWAWVTTMAYTNTHGGLITKQVFSNPRIDCDAFYKCGNAEHGDAARWLNENRAARFNRNSKADEALAGVGLNRNDTGNGIRVFPEKNQHSGGILLNNDEPDLSTRGVKNIRSYTLSPGWEVRFYEEKNYRGKYYTRSTSFSADKNDSQLNVQSMKVLKKSETPKLYTGEHFTGAITEVGTSIPDLNQKVGSFYVPRGWKIRFYTEPYYGGKYYTRTSNGSYYIINENMGSVLVMNRPY